MTHLVPNYLLLYKNIMIYLINYRQIVRSMQTHKIVCTWEKLG